MIDTPARSAIAAAIAALVRKPGSPSTSDVQGAAIIVVDAEYSIDAMLAVGGIARALNYRTETWNSETMTGSHAAERWERKMISAHAGSDSALIITRVTAAEMVGKDAMLVAIAGQSEMARLTLSRAGGHAIVIVAERDASNDALIETICDVVTAASNAGSGRDGGVEVVEL